MRLPRLCLLVATAAAPGMVCAASFDERVEALFRPPVGEMMALSPDGQRVAYTLPRRSDLRIVVMELDPAGSKRAIKLNLDDHETASAADSTPVRLRFLRWATATRLVFAPTERVIPLPPVIDEHGRAAPNPDGPTIVSPILAVDADGKQWGTLVDARDFQETPADARRTLADLLRTPKELAATRHDAVRWRMPHLDILGFFPADREQLILQTRGGYSMPRQHLVDVRTGSVREYGGDWSAPPGEPHVFDWAWLKIVGERQRAARPTTLWRDADLARVQRELEAKFPRRIVELLDWTDTRARVLFRVTGGSDPGRVFVFQRSEDLVLEILRSAPWLSAAKLHATHFFEFTAPDGARLSGYLTYPTKQRLTPPPLLVVFPSGIPGRAQPAFDPAAQVFADFGFAVARLNHRSVAGVRPEDFTALRAGVDRVSVNDALSAIQALAAQFPEQPFDARRVATLGRGFGGYLATRALQLQPRVFRCGVAIDGPMDLRAWLREAENGGAAQAQEIPAELIDHEATDWAKLSVVEQADALKSPVFLLVEPARNVAVDRATAEVRSRLQALGRAADYLELDPGFATALPASRAAVYRKIEEFLNLRLDGYAVKIGPTKEVE